VAGIAGRVQEATIDRWNQVQELSRSALAKAPAERAGFLQNACRGDNELKHEVEALRRACGANQASVRRPDLGSGGGSRRDRDRDELAPRTRGVDERGHQIKQVVFGNEDAVGREIMIRGVRFRIVGVIKKLGTEPRSPGSRCWWAESGPSR
jgi:hypothetical protein